MNGSYMVTDLMLACMNNNFNELKRLVQEGADVNQKDHNGDTGLMYACRSKDKLILSLILNAHGINVNSKSKYGDTALMRACIEEDDLTALLLLNRPALVSRY